MSSDPITQLAQSGVVDMYKAAGTIASTVLSELVNMTKQDTSVLHLCKTGDIKIMEQLSKIYKKHTNKGIAFPTCVSVNEIAGHYSPLNDQDTIIKNGDLVKIELGVHIGEYPAVVATTVIVTEDIVNDNRARVLTATAEASRKVFELMKPGKKNRDVANELKSIAKKYNCSLLKTNYIETITPGVVSYQMSKGVIDGNNDDTDEYIHQLIIPRENFNYNFQMVDMEFEEDEVYAIDIAMSTGDGKVNEKGDVTTLFKRSRDFKSLKLRTARESLILFNKQFPVSIRDPFNIRLKLGINECLKQGVLIPYPVQREKTGEFISRVKFTVIVKKRPYLIAGIPSDKQLEKVEIK